MKSYFYGRCLHLFITASRFFISLVVYMRIKTLHAVLKCQGLCLKKNYLRLNQKDLVNHILSNSTHKWNCLSLSVHLSATPHLINGFYSLFACKPVCKTQQLPVEASGDLCCIRVKQSTVGTGELTGIIPTLAITETQCKTWANNVTMWPKVTSSSHWIVAIQWLHPRNIYVIHSESRITILRPKSKYNS